MSTCISCRDEAPGQGRECCAECHWQLVAELEQGFIQLRAYLAGWAAFREWEERGACAGDVVRRRRRSA